jgi:hypothetical protein
MSRYLDRLDRGDALELGRSRERRWLVLTGPDQTEEGRGMLKHISIQQTSPARSSPA